MKKTIIIFAAITLLISCGDKKKTTTADSGTTTESNSPASSESSDEKTGEFSYDGKSVTGKTTTQYFGSDKEKSNFSVLCQHDESGTSSNFELLQITFLNEKDATANSALKLYDGSQLPTTEPEAGSYTVALSGVGDGFKDQEFTGSDKSTGSLTVSNRTVIIKDLVLFTRDGDKKTVNAKIPFSLESLVRSLCVLAKLFSFLVSYPIAHHVNIVEMCDARDDDNSNTAGQQIKMS